MVVFGGEVAIEVLEKKTNRITKERGHNTKPTSYQESN
jgi:hypothetical protein